MSKNTINETLFSISQFSLPASFILNISLIYPFYLNIIKIKELNVSGDSILLPAFICISIFLYGTFFFSCFLFSSGFMNKTLFLKKHGFITKDKKEYLVPKLFYSNSKFRIEINIKNKNVLLGSKFIQKDFSLEFVNIDVLDKNNNSIKYDILLSDSDDILIENISFFDKYKIRKIVLNKKEDISEDFLFDLSLKSLH
ncbi:MAG: hypothetical protein CL760_01315 [Chloroflexi bacterium]|nr:hypothetical protein [Chloroflexota bacterium]|tara:strand:- start:33667 stop:34260 length:594 start_codon:yes stop_codon:yes gene_type:complete